MNLLFGVFDDVSVAVDGGVATLSGRVTSAYKAAQLARAASRASRV